MRTELVQLTFLPNMIVIYHWIAHFANCFVVTVVFTQKFTVILLVLLLTVTLSVSAISAIMVQMAIPLCFFLNTSEEYCNGSH